MDERIIVAAFDPDDLPRAYGIAADLVSARQTCERELRQYRIDKKRVGDAYLADGLYTLRTAKVGDFNGVWKPVVTIGPKTK